MDIKIIPRKLKGRLDALPSKSHAHRVLIAQKLARMQNGEAANADNAHGSGIPTFSKDIEATKNCLAQLDSGSPRLNCI